MPHEPHRATLPLGPEHWARVGTAEEARRWESEETVQRPMVALDYDRAQDERWAALSPRLVEALDRLLGPAQSRIEAPPTPVIETVEYEVDLEAMAEFYGHFW